MSSTRRPPAPRRGWFSRLLLLGLGALVVLAVILAIGGRAWIESYLKSDRFRAFVSRKTSETLAAQGEFAPLHFSGTTFYSDGFKARGSTQSWFSEMRIDQIRADVSARRFFDRVWQIERIEAQQLAIRLDGPRIELPPAPPVPPDTIKPRGGRWFPDRVEIGSAAIRETSLSWGGTDASSGSLERTALGIAPHEGGWNILGTGGRLRHGGFPPAELIAASLRYHEPTLFIQSAELRQGASGALSVSGEVEFGRSLDLRTTFVALPITPHLPEDWRVRLRGDLAGDLNIRSPLPTAGELVCSGTVNLVNGQLDALPILDQIALFTRTQQFRRLSLSKASAKFTQQRERLEVQEFVAESEGLIRVEGTFAVENSIIDGTFQVGVTPASLQWLPGSQERVFTEQRGGYLWTAMRLTGPVAKPEEDLSPRLIAAAQGAVIQGVENTVKDAVQTGKDAAKGALDLLMPLLK